MSLNKPIKKLTYSKAIIDELHYGSEQKEIKEISSKFSRGVPFL